MDLISQCKSIDLVEFMREHGIDLKPAGRNFKGLCPFHAESEPSMIVTPGKNLFHCFGCNAGGSIIDFVCKLKQCSVKESISYILNTTKKKNYIIAETPAQYKVNTEQEPKLPEKKIQKILKRVEAYYHNQFMKHYAGKNYLTSRGFEREWLYKIYKIGYSTGNVIQDLNLSDKEIEDYKKIGILNENKYERFKDCVVFAVKDTKHNITTLYGRHTFQDKHVYLPDRGTGIFNAYALNFSSSILITESTIDALSLRNAGIMNVVSIQSKNGLTHEKIEIFKQHNIKKIMCVLDGDAPGQETSEKIKRELSNEFQILSLKLPKEMDPNEFVIKYGPRTLVSFIIKEFDIKKEKIKIYEPFQKPTQQENKDIQYKITRKI